jgi:hypothetical protein
MTSPSGTLPTSTVASATAGPSPSTSQSRPRAQSTGQPIGEGQ